MPPTVTGDDAPNKHEASNRRPVAFAVAVATAGVLPAFLTGGLAVQVRGELDFGAGALGVAVAMFFVTSSLGPLVFGLVVEVASYDAAWLLCGTVALVAMVAILIGRRMLLRDRADDLSGGGSPFG